MWGTFNDSEVEGVFLKEYGSLRHLYQYPQLDEVPYPKVNTTNPQVQLWVADFSNGTIEKRQVIFIFLQNLSLQYQSFFALKICCTSSKMRLVSWAKYF